MIAHCTECGGAIVRNSDFERAFGGGFRHISCKDYLRERRIDDLVSRICADDLARSRPLANPTQLTASPDTPQPSAEAPAASTPTGAAGKGVPS